MKTSAQAARPSKTAIGDPKKTKRQKRKIPESKTAAVIKGVLKGHA